MRILLFGKNGQVGWELQRSLAPLGKIMAVDTPEVDFLDLNGLRQYTLEAKPDIIVNAAAYTDVDKAESEPEIAMTINSKAPGVLAEAAKKLNVGLVHYSTDYVFDGTKREPYSEDDEPNPINVYGHTKLAGDQAIQASGCAHLILRTSWVYGTRGKNFFLTILRLAREQEEIRVVDDQVGCPTWSRAIAESTDKILQSARRNGDSKPSLDLKELTGLYNYCSSDETSWFKFAQTIVEKYSAIELKPLGEIRPISSSEYALKAMRPNYSVLDLSKVQSCFDLDIQSWREQLDDCWSSLEMSKAGGKIN